MQYQKEEVREKILAAARAEYLAHGYRGGNIGAIAEKAGVIVGNLYRYFDGKSGLLDAIVKPAYESLPLLLTEMQKVEILDSGTLSQTMPLLSGGLIEFFDRFGDDMLILMDGCDGTRYEDFSKELIGMVTHIIKVKLYPSECSEDDEALSELVGKAFCASLFDLMRRGLPHGQKQKAMERMLKFYFYEIDKRK